MLDGMEGRRPRTGDYLVEEITGTAGLWFVHLLGQRDREWSRWSVGQEIGREAAIRVAQHVRETPRIWVRGSGRGRAELLQEPGRPVYCVNCRALDLQRVEDLIYVCPRCGVRFVDGRL